MEEGDDIMLTCRVVGGKPRNKFNAFVWLLHFSMEQYHLLIERHTERKRAREAMLFNVAA